MIALRKKMCIALFSKMEVLNIFLTNYVSQQKKPLAMRNQMQNPKLPKT